MNVWLNLAMLSYLACLLQHFLCLVYVVAMVILSGILAEHGYCFRGVLLGEMYRI